MVKPSKLLKKVLSGSKNIRFDEFVSLIEAFGFELKRITGSHHLFQHPDIPDSLSIQPTKNGQMKPYQIRQFLKLMEAYNLRLDMAYDDGDDE